MVLLAEADQEGAQQRSCREIERPDGVLLQQAFRHPFRAVGREARQVDPRQG
jgi:hypothetical protein